MNLKEGFQTRSLRVTRGRRDYILDRKKIRNLCWHEPTGVVCISHFKSTNTTSNRYSELSIVKNAEKRTKRSLAAKIGKRKKIRLEEIVMSFDVTFMVRTVHIQKNPLK